MRRIKVGISRQFDMHIGDKSHLHLHLLRRDFQDMSSSSPIVVDEMQVFAGYTEPLPVLGRPESRSTLVSIPSLFQTSTKLTEIQSPSRSHSHTPPPTASSPTPTTTPP